MVKIGRKNVAGDANDPASSFKASKQAKLGRKATNWDKIREQGVDKRQGSRNIHESQQLDRGEFDKIESNRKSVIVGLVVFLMCFVFGWVIVSLLELILGIVGTAISGAGSGVLNTFGVSSGSSAEAKPAADTTNPLLDVFLSFSWLKVFLAALPSAIVGGIVYKKMALQVQAQNMMNRTDDVNLHKGDAYIQVPEEIHQRHNIFPDVGAHSSVSPTSLISHAMLSAKGLKKVEVVQRAKEDVYDENGDLVMYKGEPLRNADGSVVTKRLPIVDTEFGKELFKASGIKDKSQVRFFDATEIPYNPDNANRDKLKGMDRVSDLINNDWEFPDYEPQRPAGFYVVDTAPVNTMVLAITRGGKGQTIIEPTLDMWMREKRPSNILANDPKGELLVKNYVRATIRGFQVIQFNLINPTKTDIYNPLGMAAESAREGDFFKCGQYVEDIAGVLFPVDGGDDPVWPNAANNAFKRAAYGLIDFYLEEENELRNYAFRTDMDQSVLENKLDAMWGKVTLYNCYQFFVQLTSKKVKAPLSTFKDKVDSGEFDEESAEYEYERARAEEREFLWEGKAEADMLSLYFSATEELPQNGMRSLINNANNALKSMAGAERMLSSVYGIAITGMSFFTDKTIARLTSGTPSQNTDLGGMSFPRRMGVRFNATFLKRDSLAGLEARWDAFSDPGFSQNLGKDFYHEDMVGLDGWARYYFDGLFPDETSYIRLRLLNSQTGALVRTYYFQFTKGYQTNLSGAQLVKDPITGKKIVRNGVLVELVKSETGEYVVGHSTFKELKLQDYTSNNPTPAKVDSPVFVLTTARYTERPKMVFLVTPPHLMKYAKLILILLRQMVNLNFESSYMTKENQKPLYKTRYMLDELGNLQSEGHGISGFETMLSIGLGQDQQFTLILQTLQQLRDVYGESVDKIVQGNAQPLDAKIATPTGWTSMGEVVAGQTEVLVPAGGSALVTGVYPKGEREVFEVATADGAVSRACDEHLWDVEIELPEGMDASELEQILA